jgi:hypothetical protein
MLYNKTQYLLFFILLFLNSDMKVAIQICGQPRFTADFTNFLNNLKGYNQADWFCYFTGDNRHLPPEKLPSNIWKEITDVKQASDNLQSILPQNNYVRSFEISDSDSADLPTEPDDVPTPAYKMWYNMFQVNRLRIDYEKQNNITYDMVIRTRPDTGLVNVLDLRNINLDLLKMAVVTPKNKIAGHFHFSINSPEMCDLFAIASPEHMNTYSGMIQTAHENFFTQNRRQWHTESALALYLLANHIPLSRGDFIVSLRGDSN